MIATLSESPLQRSSAQPIADAFPFLAIDDEPTPAGFASWLRQLLKSFQSWGEPEPEDCTQYGLFVREAGLIAAYLGYADLYLESLLVARELSVPIYGHHTPVCTQTEAYAFFAKCISRSNTASTVQPGAVDRKSKAPKSSDGVDCIDGKANPVLKKRFAQALEWEAQATVRLGKGASIWEIYCWAKKNKDNYDLEVTEKYDTFANYLRVGRLFLKRTSEAAVVAATRVTERYRGQSDD